MKIVSEINDYYDYLSCLCTEPYHLQTIYKRDYIDKISPRWIEKEEGDKNKVCIYFCNNFSDLVDLRKFGKYYLGFSLLEIGRIQYLFIETINLETFETEQPLLLKKFMEGLHIGNDEIPISYISLGRLKINSVSFLNRKIDYPEQILDFDISDDFIRKIDIPLAPGEVFENIILSDKIFNLSKFINAEEVYASVDQYLREFQFSDQEILDTRSNNIKILLIMDLI